MRVAEHLNRSLHALMESDPSVHLLGEDVSDPYGGAFKITKGLSDRFGPRVMSTPLSEGGIVGVGAGLALAGDRAIVEIMFGDFATLAFDQLVNFAAKSTTMYGRRVDVPLIVRLPTGGRRGYGPTHSQSLQKHFIGVPGLSVYEMSPFHDAERLFGEIFASGTPAVFFEDKVLYTKPMLSGGDGLHTFELRDGWAVIRAEEDTEHVLLAPGGLTDRAVAALRDLLLEDEIACTLLVPARLHPLDVTPVADVLAAARRVHVAEDGTAGGTWGAEVARVLHERLWGRLTAPITHISAPDSIIPTAAHLEARCTVQPADIRRAINK
uniref:alpha-ketoacid dehydrogenase subunit beta n=1 Tax=Herbidospora sakaeratensis TaxID=564415 RepID=UPI0007809521|nr:transketolase C-terminal domain-containing protein [Herbidospora sakaeratensis]